MVEKDWTFEQVKEADDRARRSKSFADRTLPSSQWYGLHRIDAEEKRYLAGDKMALLSAIRICANHDLVMPEWVSNAYIRAYDRVLNCHVGSWDDAFGLPYPKGTHLSRLRQRRILRLQVLNRVDEIRDADPKRPIDDGLFEEVGQEFGIGKTLASELYYQGKRIYR